jgi:hypothetical protein
VSDHGVLHDLGLTFSSLVFKAKEREKELKLLKAKEKVSYVFVW